MTARAAGPQNRSPCARGRAVMRSMRSPIDRCVEFGRRDFSPSRRRRRRRAAPSGPPRRGTFRPWRDSMTVSREPRARSCARTRNVTTKSSSCLSASPRSANPRGARRRVARRGRLVGSMSRLPLSVGGGDAASCFGRHGLSPRPAASRRRRRRASRSGRWMHGSGRRGCCACGARRTKRRRSSCRCFAGSAGSGPRGRNTTSSRRRPKPSKRGKKCTLSLLKATVLRARVPGLRKCDLRPGAAAAPREA